MQEMTIAELQGLMTDGALTARRVTEMYLQRIEEIDRNGPFLNSVIEINPDALAVADALDAERAAQGPRGPLHGVPILIKDNIDTADRMQTTAGSLALAGSIAAGDAFVVQRLREAGAIILGKANLSEWANFRSTCSVSGWSSRGGQTRNPYALDRNASGSSSGSAVAVAANLCAAAVGTETDGSIISPARVNGIVGLKPTVGLLSRAGIIPIAHSQDTAGPMARTVADAAALLGALVGIDARDPVTVQSGGRSYTDFTRFLDRDGLRGARLGVARNFFGFHPGVDRIMEGCIDLMRRLGAQVVDPANVATDRALKDAERLVLLYEFKADLDAYLEQVGPQAAVHSLADVIAYNDAHREQIMPHFGQERMLQAQEKGPLTSDEYLAALAASKRLARDEGIDATLKAHHLDAIVAPSGGPAWLTDYVNGDLGSGGSASPAAVAGYPNITVPAGFICGLPVGISFFASAFAEPALIRLAYAFEQAQPVRRPPTFLPTADIDRRSRAERNQRT